MPDIPLASGRHQASVVTSDDVDDRRPNRDYERETAWETLMPWSGSQAVTRLGGAAPSRQRKRTVPRDGDPPGTADGAHVGRPPDRGHSGRVPNRGRSFEKP